MSEGITFFSGLIMRWFRDAFCEIEKQEALARGLDTYTILEEKAKKVFSAERKEDIWVLVLAAITVILGLSGVITSKTFPSLFF